MLKPHASAPPGGDTLEVALGDGDLVVMGGDCQRTHTHEVPKRRRKDAGAPGDRVSWTFRSFRVCDDDRPAAKRQRRR